MAEFIENSKNDKNSVFITKETEREINSFP